MAAGREGTGLTVLRIFIGVFFIFVGTDKWRWLFDHSALTMRLQDWLVTAGPYNRWYIEHVCLPGAPIFARLVMLGETATGVGLVLGVWTRLVAALAFLMVANIHFASGEFLRFEFLTNGYGLPVLGALLALAIGGARLPLSLRK
ncbi:MAG: DoxX family protein [Vicinamibacterales bacterium]